MLSKLGLTGLTMIAVVGAMAQTAECRIDISGMGTPKVGMVFDRGSADVTGAKADWLKADMDKRLMVSAPMTASWKEYTFTFTPKTSGAVDLMLMGNGTGKRYWVWFDSLKVSGATLNNGSLEQLNGKGVPEGWATLKSPQVMTDGKAQDGKTYVKVTHDQRLMQRLNVEQGKPVTVSFFARIGDPLELDLAK